MDEARLKDIEARAVAQTPGTSVLTERGGMGWDVDVLGPDAQKRDLSGIRGMFWRWEDAEFYAAARQDVPALIAEVRRLRDFLRWTDDELLRIAALGISPAVSRCLSVLVEEIRERTGERGGKRDAQP
jgi:hypothetical protein